jgi:hypothetical protein
VKEEGSSATKQCTGFNGWMLREEGKWQKKDFPHSPTLALSRYHYDTRGEPLARQSVKK